MNAGVFFLLITLLISLYKQVYFKDLVAMFSSARTKTTAGVVYSFLVSVLILVSILIITSGGKCNTIVVMLKILWLIFPVVAH